MGNKLGNTKARTAKPIKTEKKHFIIKTKLWFWKTKEEKKTGNISVYKNGSDLKRPPEENIHTLALKKFETPCKENRDALTEVKSLEVVQTFIRTFEEDGFTRKEEKATADGSEIQSTDRKAFVADDDAKHEIPGSPNNMLINTSDNENNSEFSNTLVSSRNSSKSEHSCSLQENGNLKSSEKETENENGANVIEIMETYCIAEENEEINNPKNLSTENEELIKIYSKDLDDHDVSLNNRSDNSTQNNQKKSPTSPKNDSIDVQKGAQHGYMTVAEYADSAKHYTLSRLQTKDKTLYVNFKSLPNLSDIKNTNPEYQDHYMKELVFPGAAEINVSLSDIYTYETDENFQIMQEVKNGSGLEEDDTINQMQELKVIEDSQTVTKNRRLFEVVADTQTGTKNMRYIKRSQIQSVTAQTNIFDRNIPARRFSGRTVSSTDSGRSSNVTDLSATKRKQLQPGYTKYLCNPDCTACRAARIEYMVEVYEPLIIKQITVIDILDFLPLIDKRLMDMLRSKHSQSPHEAMELLIRQIRKSDIPGKWQSFLDAIHKTEFTYICMLLNEETEVQYNYSTDVLSLIKPEIMARMCLPEFLDKVFQKELLTEMEKDEANSLSTGITAKAYILDRIDKHLPNWDNVFVKVLNESYMSDLADLFLLVSQKETFLSESNPTAKGKQANKQLRHAIRNQRLQLNERAHGRSGFQPQMKPALFQKQSRSADNNDELSVSQVKGIDRTERHENKSRKDLAKIDVERHVGDKDIDESNMNQNSLLQNILFELTEVKHQQQALLEQVKDLTEVKHQQQALLDQVKDLMEVKHQQQALFNQVKDLSHGMTELRLCVNKL